MSNSVIYADTGPASSETPGGQNYRAVIDSAKCFGRGECLKVCPVNAIREGPKRLPSMITCATMELLPGKAVVNQGICNGCGECVVVCPTNAIKMVPLA